MVILELPHMITSILLEVFSVVDLHQIVSQI